MDSVYAYDMIDRFLRNNLDDTDYAEYSEALEFVFSPSPANEITRLKAELAAAHQEIAALKGDAERYQHLKANNTWASWLAINYKPNAWDEKIDAAMQGKDE